jgi:hypothetical protein
MKDTAQLVNQFDKYCSILKKVTQKNIVEQMVDTIGQRLLMSPRGLTEEEGGIPGGLVEFSLATASAAKSLGGTFGNTKSLVKVSLLHELGKIGGIAEDTDLYLVQDSDWHREKLGHVYKYNDKCPRMNVAHRSLWILSHFGFDLSREEWTAINLSQGLHLPENQFYAKSLDSVSAGLLSARLSILHGLDS